jgi:hypothetical protein
MMHGQTQIKFKGLYFIEYLSPHVCRQSRHYNTACSTVVILLAIQPKIKKWPLLPDVRTKFLFVTLLGRQRQGRGNITSVYFVTARGKHSEVRRMSREHTKLFQCRKYYTYWLDTIVETTKDFLTALRML